MAGNQIGYTTGDAVWTNFVSAMEKQRKGMLLISLNNYDVYTAPSITQGSVLEVSGALFELDSGDETITGSPSTGNLNFVYAQVAGVDPNQTVTFVVSTTAPTWDDAKQGYYNGSDRCVAAYYYDGTNYWPKWIIRDQDDFPVGQEIAILPYGAGTGTANLGWLRFNGQGRMFPLDFPQGAIVTELWGNGVSPNANVFLQLNLYLSPLTTTATTLMAQCQWNNSSGTVTDTTITSAIVDITTNSYILQGLETSGLGNGDLYGASVKYYHRSNA